MVNFSSPIGCVPRTARAAVSTAFETSRSRPFFADMRKFFSDVDLSKFARMGIDFTNSHLCELLVFVVRLARANGIFDAALACFDYLRHNMSLDDFLKKSSYLITFVRAACSEFYEAFCDEISNEATPIADGYAQLLGMFGKFTSCELFDSLKKLITSLASLKFFDKDVSKRIFRSTGERPSCELDAISQILKAFHTLIASGERLLNGEKLSSILASEDPYADFMAEAKRLIAMKDFTYIGKPVPGYIHRTEFARSVDETLRAGSKLVKVTPRNSPQYPPLFALDLKLTQVSNELQNAVHGERRMTPFAIKLVGPPGVGKSTIFDYIVKMHSRALGREYSDEYVYHRNIASDYWEGLKPLSQDVYHYSEAGNTAKKIATSQSDPVLQEITSLIDSLPMTVNMAAIESKGNTFVCPSLVIADINDANMNASYQVNNPAAFHRRWLTIEVSVKPEYRMAASMQLDSQKCLDELHNDFWNFRVSSYRAQSASTGSEVVELEQASLAELRDFLILKMTSHYDRQAAVLEKVKNVNIDDFQNVVHESNVSEYTNELPEQEFCPYETCELFGSWMKFSILSFGAWIAPDFAYKMAIPRIRREAVAYSSHKKTLARSQFWESLGYEPEVPYTIPAVVNINVLNVISVVLNVISVCLFMRAIYATHKVSNQGAVMSKSSDRDDQEVADGVVTLEQQIGVERPRSVKFLKPNADWFQRDSLALKYLKNKETTNEPVNINRRALRNLRFFIIDIEVDGRVKEVRTRGLGVCEDFMVMNKHCFFDNEEIRMTQVSYGDETPLRRQHLTEFFDMGTDLVLVRVPGDKFADIRKILLDPMDMTSSSVSGYIADPKGVETRIYPAPDQTIKFQGKSKLQKDLLKYPWEDHSFGKCGTPILAQLGRSYGIVGIHSAGNDATHFGYCQRLHPALVEEGILTLSKVSPYLRVNSEGDVRLDGLVDEPHKRSPLRHEGCERIRYQGTLPGNMPPTHSNIKHSALFDEVAKIADKTPFGPDGAELYGPPVMRAITVDGRFYDPESNFYRKLDKTGVALHSKRMERAIFAVVDHVITNLYDRGIDHLAPVDIYTSQNGHADNYYMRTMKNSTSGGFPWPGSKRKLLLDEPREGKPDGKMPKTEVLDHMLYQAGAYARNEDACPLLGAQLKDEPRAASKNKYAKTRVFMMSPYESTLLQRSLLMPFYTLMCEHRDIFCCSIGINMHSTDVDEFVHDLTSFADHFMEGDYGGFDTSMPYEIGLAANTVVYTICAQLGYNEEALRQVKGLLSDNLYPTCVVRGDVIQVPALQPSGKYATAEDNSLRGLLMLVYYYVCQFPERDAATFFEQVKPRIYGDDLLAAVKPESRHLFNNVSYSQFCEDAYGIEYTNAQKTKDFAPFLKFQETSFLKRTFVYREDLGHWVAPLDKTSIMKSVAYILPSKVVSEEEQTMDSVVSAMREMYFHSSEEEYEKRRREVAAMVEAKYNLAQHEFLKRLPSFWNITASLFDEHSEISSESDVRDVVLHESEEKSQAIAAGRRFGAFWGRRCARFIKQVRESAPILKTAFFDDLQECSKHEDPTTIFGTVKIYWKMCVWYPIGITITSLAPNIFLMTLFPDLPPIVFEGFYTCVAAPVVEELWKEYSPLSRWWIGYLEFSQSFNWGNLMFHLELNRQVPDLSTRIKFHAMINTAVWGFMHIPYVGTPLAMLVRLRLAWVLYSRVCERHGYHFDF